MSQTDPKVLVPDWDEYQLLDCGGRRKLERFGETTLIRSEPKAWWVEDATQPWRQAAAESNDVAGSWRQQGKFARSWRMRYRELVLEARITDGSKHVGMFPEQEPHWRWLDDRLRTMQRPRVLNLFGYTGIASLVAAAAGAEVTHVDASKPSLAWARHNQELSAMTDAPIRWLLDDAFKFVARELRRERQYEVILLDPPSFGRGPKGEIWKVEQQVAPLLDNLSRLINPKRGIVVLTMYNLEASSLMLASLMQDYFPGGRLEFGELALPSISGRILPMSLFARWESN